MTSMKKDKCSTYNFYAIDVFQVSIESSAIANEYEDVAVDPGFPILKDMFFDQDERHLYILTPNKVSQANTGKSGRHHSIYLSFSCPDLLHQVS